jgi:2-hydroxy-6-oxonona-2,4-dienedioate hydrolase
MSSIDPRRTAVIAVHYQNDIVGPDGAFAPFFHAEVERVGVIPTTARLLDAARAAGTKVAYTRVAFQPGYPDLVANSPLLGIVVQQKCLVDGTPGAAIVDELAPRDGDIVVTHQRVTGFQASELDVLLRGSGVDTVVVIGVATNASVEGTARAASDLGYRTIVVSDACSAGSDAAHQASLESLGLLAEITTTDELLTALATAPAGDGRTGTTTDTPVWVALGAVEHRLRYVDVGPWRTRVLEAGQGAPVICMPGTGGHLEAYAHNIGALAEQYHVVAYDWPGHGYTTHAKADLELDTYVGHLVDLMDVLGFDKAHLIGESLGGWVAVKFAAAHPDRVGKLVLDTPGGTMARPDVMEKIRSLSQAAADDPTPERIRARLEWLMADPGTVTDELVEIRRRIYARPGFADSMRQILCLQDPEIRRRNLITDDDLAAVPGPALVVWTSDDPSGPAGAGIEMADKIRGGRFELIPGAGHWPQWEQRDRFNQLVLAFLADQ